MKYSAGTFWGSWLYVDYIFKFKVKYFGDDDVVDIEMNTWGFLATAI